MSDEDYTAHMQKLNVKQYELVSHVVEQLMWDEDQMCIFLEGGAGVGKTMCARGLHETIRRFYSTQPGECADMVPVLVLAPTGMAAYHIQGNTIHSGLHIPINQGEMNPLGSSELNTLRCKYNNVKVVFIDEISMVGSQLFIKIDQRLQQIFGCRKFCGGLHVIADETSEGCLYLQECIIQLPGLGSQPIFGQLSDVHPG
jgi:hypothetical protein